MKNNCHWWIIIIHTVHSTLCTLTREIEIHTCGLHIMPNYSQTVVIWDLIVADLCNPHALSLSLAFALDPRAEQTMEMPVQHGTVVSVFAYGIWLRLFDNSWVEPTESLRNYLHLFIRSDRVSECILCAHFDESLEFPVHCWRTRQIYGIHESHSKPKAFNLIWLLDKYFHFNLFQQFTTL